jgi:hypothetical protein
MEFIGVSQRKLDLRREMPWLARKVGISGLPRGFRAHGSLPGANISHQRQRPRELGSDGAKSLWGLPYDQ